MTFRVIILAQAHRDIDRKQTGGPIIKDDAVFDLTVHRSAQEVLCPSDVESPPSA